MPGPRGNQRSWQDVADGESTSQEFAGQRSTDPGHGARMAEQPTPDIHRPVADPPADPRPTATIGHTAAPQARVTHEFGSRNVHCMNCGDTRGGPVGHETSECTWTSAS